MGTKGRVFYAAGVDPALGEKASSCDGAIVVGRGVIPEDVRPSEAGGRLALNDVQLDIVYALTLRNTMVTEWAGWIHFLNSRWGFSIIGLDSGKGGAGPDIRKELARPMAYLPGSETATPVTPIATLTDHTVVGAIQNLMMFSRGDPWMNHICEGFRGDDQLVDWGHRKLEEALRGGVLGLPADSPGRSRDVKLKPEYANRDSEWFETWNQCDKLRLQLQRYGVEKRAILQSDGTSVMQVKLSSNGARTFLSPDLMDLVDATMMMVSATSAWLWQEPAVSGDSGGGGCEVWGRG